MALPLNPVRVTALALILAVGAPLAAGSITGAQARQAAAAWLAGTPTHLKATLPTEIDQVKTHTGTDGRVLFHEVRLSGQGFVIMAPDDLLEPVIAFSPTGTLSTDPESHLYLLLSRDMRSRLELQAKVARRTATASTQPLGRVLTRALAASTQGRKRWTSLLGTSQAATSTSLTTLDDVRVAPLLSSEWSQSTVNAKNVYNYYTPNNYVCGCVATAMAQLMRYHTFPTAGIGLHSFTVTVDGVSKTLSTRGGNGLGGAYAWTSMPLVPSSTTLTTAQCQAIGNLCFDAGVSVSMAYASDGSGAYMPDAATELRDTFSYANTNYYYDSGLELTGNGLTEMVQPDLDAGYPVLFGITGDGGHAIVCDGYGYSGTTLYHHLNLGWGGYDDAWYNLPNIGTDYNFDLIDECIFNVYPEGTGEILSGRVTDTAGDPVSGVTVTNGTLTSTTDAQGIYALKGLAAGSATVTANLSGYTFPTAMRIVKTSVDSTTIGNLWGVDLVENAGATPTILPEPASQEVKLGESVTFTAGVTGIGPLSLAWTKNGTVVQSDSLTYTLDSAAATDDQAAIVLNVTGSQGTAASTAATLSVVRLFNGTFEAGRSGWTLSNIDDTDVVLGVGTYSNVVPHGGDQWLCIGDWEQACSDYAEQDVVLPSTNTLTLSFYAGIANRTSTPSTVANVFTVKVLDSDDNVLGTLVTLDNTDAELDTSGDVAWKAYGPYDLRAWKGQTVKVRIGSTQAGGNRTGTIFAVDDVVLESSDAGPTAVLGQGAMTLVTGGTASFTATVTGYASDNGVDWTLGSGGGTLDPATTPGDGTTATLFTGGSTAGVFTLTATPVETPNTPASTTVTLVDPASVSLGLEASATTAALGHGIALTTAVTPLTDTSVAWSTTGGSFVSSTTTTTTWSSSTAGTFTITATSQGAPTRNATTILTAVDPSTITLTLDPVSTTLLPGASLAFTASGSQALGVTWTLTSPATKVDDGLTTTVTIPSAGLLATTTCTLTAALTAAPTIRSSASITVKGMDLVADGTLDPRDLLALAAEWGKGTGSAANFKGSGTVDDTDLAALLSQIP